MAHLRARTAVSILIVTSLAVAACTSHNTAAGNGGLTGQTPSLSPAPPSGSASVNPTGTATSTATGTSTGTSTATATGTKAAPSGPRILSFTIVQQPACPFVPASDSPYTAEPGMNLVLKWSTSGGVTGVALSLDDPNYYKNNHFGSIDTYPASGTAEVPFVCDPTVQPDTTHKYTLDTIGGGDYVQQTLTVTKQTSP